MRAVSLQSLLFDLNVRVSSPPAFSNRWSAADSLEKSPLSESFTKHTSSNWKGLAQLNLFLGSFLGAGSLTPS